MMEMTLDLAIFIFAAQFIGYIVKGLAGFGNPLIANPIMAMRIDNLQITPGVLPVDRGRKNFCVYGEKSSLIRSRYV